MLVQGYQPTCLTFALKMTAGQVQPEQCPALFTDAYREKREKLVALLEGAL